MDTANRRVNQIEPSERSPSGAARIFDYRDHEVIILLGDPGAGKTYSFDWMAGAEQAPVYSVQRFLARNGDCAATTVYLDGLDEYRPRGGRPDLNPLVELLQTLRSSGAPRLRLSCRFADWLGSTDLELFRDYRRSYVVLGLCPLDDGEAAEILARQGVANPNALLAEAASRGMEWTVSNARNLVMLAKVVRCTGWPGTKRELYESWCLTQLAEHKASLQESTLGQYLPGELISPAGAVCAAMMISDVTAVRRGPSDDPLAPNYEMVCWPDKKAVAASLNRNVFTSSDQGDVTFIHRTVAEYLGARWLGKRVKEGLPLSRIQALLGVDSHPASSLRGNARSSVESRNPRLAHFTTLCAVSQLRTWTALELPEPGLAPGFVCAL